MGLDLIGYLGHRLQIFLVAVKEGAGKEVIKLVFVVLLHIQTVSMRLFESVDVA